MTKCSGCGDWVNIPHPFECNICDAKFCSQDCLDAHMEDEHIGEDEL